MKVRVDVFNVLDVVALDAVERVYRVALLGPHEGQKLLLNQEIFIS